MGFYVRVLLGVEPRGPCACYASISLLGCTPPAEIFLLYKHKEDLWKLFLSYFGSNSFCHSLSF